ncbi:MAG TPA: tetratricopeptide repeat protein [Polyangia bacterium]|nr:tetratricopeptide repeat protein [Polyangia bacterium]
MKQAAGERRERAVRLALELLRQDWCIRRGAFAVAVFLLVVGRASAAPTAAASLAEARAALEAGQPDRAARIAERVVAADPENGDAHMVLGLAHFRAHRYHEAVEAFEAAAHAARPIAAPVVAFNKGSALFKAGQPEAAELAFLAAAADPKLAAVAVANAAWAALQGEQIERARELAARAAAQPRAAELASVLDDLRHDIDEEAERLADIRVRRVRREARQALDQGKWLQAIAGYKVALREAQKLARPSAELGELNYALGVAQYRAGRFEDARRSFSAAAALVPSEGEFLMMAAVSAARLDEVTAARHGFEEALRRDNSPETAELIRGYLEALSPGLATRGDGVSLGAAVVIGVDSNVGQSGVGLTETLTNTGSSGFLEAALDLAWRFPIRGIGHAELAYNFDQTAFFDGDLDEFSLQQHTLEATGELRPLPWLRLALLGGGDLLFSGIADFSPFQIGGSLRPMLSLDEGPHARTRLELEHSWKHSLSTAFAHLSGTRTDLTIAEELGTHRLRLALGYRYRDEALPTPERIDVGTLPNLGNIGDCVIVSCTYVIPYGYTAHAVSIRGTVIMPPLGRLFGSASYERRDYSDDSYIESPFRLFDPHRTRRHDRRYGFAIALTLAAGTAYEATLRYDLLVSRSNIDNTVDPLLYDDKNFTKHVVSVEAASDWIFRR